MTDVNFISNLFRLDNKVAVVTGAAGILGTQFCRGLGEMGAKIIMSDINQDICEKAANDLIKKHSLDIEVEIVDLANENSILDWSRRIKDRYGCVDILVNNAGAKADDFFLPLEKYKLTTWKKVQSVNMDAIFLTCRELGPCMAERGSGSIINIASIYGVVGPDQRIYDGSWYEDLGGSINTPMIYAATKGSVVAMTKYLATYWGRKGVRVNAITPGGVESGQNEVFMNNYSDRTPLGRMAKNHEMIGAAIYLSSDASSYVTGHNLIVDGGWTAW